MPGIIVPNPCSSELVDLQALKELSSRSQYALTKDPKDSEDIANLISWLTAFSSEAEPDSQANPLYVQALIVASNNVGLLAHSPVDIDEAIFRKEIDNILLLLRGIQGSGKLPQKLVGCKSMIQSELRDFCGALETELRLSIGLSG
ncbi:MAG: hypothetical protein K0S20_641 [Patescibacteria group bacterium]|jgi:hypothetical protein|nr:hypothetical protein [Patescibacteria group bacterium]